MVNKVKNAHPRDAVRAKRRVTKSAKPVGRPPANGTAPRRISLAPATLRAWLASVQAALAAPRAASTATSLAALQADMLGKLGPHADPAYKAGKPGPVPAERRRWRVVQADGTDTEHTTLAKAAAAYGAKPASLRVMLSRGGGKCQRPAIYNGAESQVTCEQLA